jgi:two-component system, OmpR family, response regulator
MRMLYVDDEADIREVARMSMELDPEAVVETAASGAEALEKTESFQPDVILLDVMMPEMDGPTTFLHLQERFSPCPPVIFVTARTQTHEVARFRALGALAVIAKPFDPMTFAAQVRAVAASA